MQTLILKTAQKIYRHFFARSLATREQCLAQLVAGDVDGAIAILEAASPRIRRMALNKSVITNPIPNHRRRRIARAPRQIEQVGFFIRARELTPLRGVDELKYRIALNYQAVEADERAVVQEAKVFFDGQRPALKRARAYTNFVLMSAKRGHHLYYSAAFSDLHAALSSADFKRFEAITDDAQAFFTDVTAKVRDKGFGWALPNAMRIAGLGFVYWRTRGDEARAEEKKALMSAMFQLTARCKTGPMEGAQVRRSVNLLNEIDSLTRDFSEENARKVFQSLVSLRSIEAIERLSGIFFQNRAI